MATKLVVLLSTLQLVCVVFVSGCTQSETKYVCPDSTTIVSNVSLCPKTVPTSETLILTAGEITKDSFGNDYTVVDFSGTAVDLRINSRLAYVYLNNDGAVQFYNTTSPGLESPTYVDGVRIYLEAFDKINRKATIEVIKVGD